MFAPSRGVSGGAPVSPAAGADAARAARTAASAGRRCTPSTLPASRPRAEAAVLGVLAAPARIQVLGVDAPAVAVERLQGGRAVAGGEVPCRHHVQVDAGAERDGGACAVLVAHDQPGDARSGPAG